jgi:hypothetical protein
MIRSMGPRDLYNKLHDEPFKSFRVRLSNGTSVNVLDAGSVIISPTSAIMPLEYVDDAGIRLVRRWKTVALSHMVEFIDLDAKDNGSSKKRRR